MGIFSVIIIVVACGSGALFTAFLASLIVGGFYGSPALNLAVFMIVLIFWMNVFVHMFNSSGRPHYDAKRDDNWL